MRGLQVTPAERRQAFCVSAKICSGKAGTEEEATQACQVSLSQPREPKARRSRGVGKAGCSGMRLVLLTTSDCNACSAAKQYLRDKLDKGLIQELNIQKSAQAADLAAKYHFTSVPKLLVLDDEGIPFSQLQITDTEQTL
jgi:glutaredoxin